MDEPTESVPEIYLRCLRLRRRGLSPQEIAALLGIPEEAWEAFVALAEAKVDDLDPLR